MLKKASHFIHCLLLMVDFCNCQDIEEVGTTHVWWQSIQQNELQSLKGFSLWNSKMHVHYRL